MRGFSQSWDRESVESVLSGGFEPCSQAFPEPCRKIRTRIKRPGRSGCGWLSMARCLLCPRDHGPGLHDMILLRALESGCRFPAWNRRKAYWSATRSGRCNAGPASVHPDPRCKYGPDIRDVRGAAAVGVVRRGDALRVRCRGDTAQARRRGRTPRRTATDGALVEDRGSPVTEIRQEKRARPIHDLQTPTV